MNVHRLLLAVAASLPLLTLYAGIAAAGAGYSVIHAGVDCANGTTASLTWSHSADPANPPDPYEPWVGYDVYRRTLADCGGLVRLNPEIIPKAPLFQTLSWNDAPPGRTAFEYRVIPVDANRQEVTIPFCEVHTTTWTSCPESSTPITVGRLEDWGWALSIHPCAEGCWPGAYFDIYEEPFLTELRPYAGTQTVIRFFGDVGCCSVEGPSIHIDRYEIGLCGPTPAARASWGQLKAIYR